MWVTEDRFFFPDTRKLTMLFCWMSVDSWFGWPSSQTVDHTAPWPWHHELHKLQQLCCSLWSSHPVSPHCSMSVPPTYHLAPHQEDEKLSCKITSPVSERHSPLHVHRFVDSIQQTRIFRLTDYTFTNYGVSSLLAYDVLKNNTDISKQLAASLFREMQRMIYLEDEVASFPANVCTYTPVIVPYAQRLETSSALLWEPQISHLQTACVWCFSPVPSLYHPPLLSSFGYFLSYSFSICLWFFYIYSHFFLSLKQIFKPKLNVTPVHNIADCNMVCSFV